MKMIGADYSQAELRVIACETIHWGCPEKNMIEVYLTDDDIHIKTPCGLKGISREDFSNLDKSEQKAFRQIGKGSNFSLVYGTQAKGFRDYSNLNYGTSLSLEEAESYRQTFLNVLYPALPEWHAKKIIYGKKHGYVLALNGLKRRLPGINSQDKWLALEWERKCINSGVQAFGASFVLMALNLLHRDMEASGIEWLEPFMTVHDSIYFRVEDYYAEEAMGIIRYYMEEGVYHYLNVAFNYRPPIPFKCDLSIGDNLATLKEEKDLGKFYEKIKPSWASFNFSGYEVNGKWAVQPI